MTEIDLENGPVVAPLRRRWWWLVAASAAALVVAVATLVVVLRGGDGRTVRLEVTSPDSDRLSMLIYRVDNGEMRVLGDQSVLIEHGVKEAQEGPTSVELPWSMEAEIEEGVRIVSLTANSGTGTGPGAPTLRCRLLIGRKVIKEMTGNGGADCTMPVSRMFAA